jgi:transposase InsO family protein
VLAAHRRAAEAAGLKWKTAVYQQIQTQSEGGEAWTVERMCTLADVSRAGVDRFPPEPPGPDPDMELRDALQRIALEFPSYGRPRMTAELRRLGWAVNHKRVYRLMREDNRLCLRKRQFVVTTDSDHSLPVYPNLARGMALTGLDQLWVADITSIRLELEFVYLAVMLEAFSRRVIGGALDRTLEAALALQALRLALARRRPAPGLVHHLIAACSMPATITPNCSRSTASESACRAKPILGTTRRANHP